jgi:hypothetical protein
MHCYFWKINQDEKAARNITQRLIFSEFVEKIQWKTCYLLLIKWKWREQNAFRKSDKTNFAVD